MTPDLPDFAPVPTAPRHDGWTPERQRRFVAALAETGGVAAACRTVGLSVTSAYRLRARADAAGFAAAWGAALAIAGDRRCERAVERAARPCRSRPSSGQARRSAARR